MARKALGIGLALLLAATSGYTRSAGEIAYVSGGIGVAEQEQLKARETEFNLKLVFTLVEGNYLADVRVAVKSNAGRTVVEDIADGPFFLAKLPAGQYTVAATYEGKTVTRKVSVGARGLRTEYFRWPSNPAEDLPVSRWVEPGDGPKAKAEKKPGPVARPVTEAPRGGAVAVISGGIGEDALAEMKAQEGSYNLKLVFTLTEGNYLADVGVVLRDAAGRSVVEHLAGGPIFLAKLPAGNYSASVSYNGKAQSRKFAVGGRMRTEYFRWPGNPEADFPLQRDQAEEAKPKARSKRD